MNKFIEIISSECPHVEEANVTIEHGVLFEEAETLAETLKSQLSVSHIRITYLPPAIMVHGGPAFWE
jgi:fatty acid-binding protein DegV